MNDNRKKMRQIPFLSMQDPEAVALIDDYGASFTYRELHDESLRWRETLSQDKSLIFLYCRNTSQAVAAFLGGISAGHAVALLDANLPPAARAELADNYSPEIVIDGSTIEKYGAPRHSINPKLSVLMSTSGSTGGAKFVRLSLANLIHNAAAISEVLEIKQSDVASGHLPLNYSYGLSVLTSHLIRGAKILLTERSFMDHAFWQSISETGVTHFPGVPFHYEMMTRLRLERLKLETVRTMTQAGGHLPQHIKANLHEYMSINGGNFYVMYGQTEASPRITTLQHKDFLGNEKTVGTVLPGGRITITDDKGALIEYGNEGAVWYEGPNVMLGYANGRQDLKLGDINCGALQTGDTGFLDVNGRLTITGRLKRFGKIFGLRVNLDEIEKRTKECWSEAAVVQKAEKVCVYLAGKVGDAEKELIRKSFVEYFTLPLTAYDLIEIDCIPYSERGKVNYKVLEEL